MNFIYSRSKVWGLILMNVINLQTSNFINFFINGIITFSICSISFFGIISLIERESIKTLLEYANIYLGHMKQSQK